MGEAKRVHLRASAAAQILCDNEFVTMLCRTARGRLDAEVGGDSTEDDGADAAAPQL